MITTVIYHALAAQFFSVLTTLNSCAKKDRQWYIGEAQGVLLSMYTLDLLTDKEFLFWTSDKSCQ